MAHEPCELKPAWLITQVQVDEPARLRPYLASVLPLIHKHGGEVLDVLQAREILEGAWPHGAFSAIVRFPDAERLRAFWADPDYEPLRRLRNDVSTSAVVAAESVLT